MKHHTFNLVHMMFYMRVMNETNKVSAQISLSVSLSHCVSHVETQRVRLVT